MSSADKPIISAGLTEEIFTNGSVGDVFRIRPPPPNSTVFDAWLTEPGERWSGTYKYMIEGVEEDGQLWTTNLNTEDDKYWELEDLQTQNIVEYCAGPVSRSAQSSETMPRSQLRERTPLPTLQELAASLTPAKRRGGSIKNKRKVKRKRSMRERRRGLKKTLKRRKKKINNQQ